MICQIDTSRLLCQIAIAGLLLLAVFASCFRHSAPASISATAPRPAASSRWCSATAPLPAASSRWCFATAPLPAASSRWLFAAAPLPVAAMPRRSLQQHLCHGAPASNKPHPAEKSTPVWLAIWRTWAGFANSQLRRATIRAPNNISAHPPCCHIGRCSDRANLSTHLHRLPTPPPYLRRMRLSPGRDAGIGGNDVAAWPRRRCWV